MSIAMIEQQKNDFDSNGFIVLEDFLEAAAAQIAGDGRSAAAARLDVTSTTEVDALFAELVQARGRLDILVNSAGLGQNVVPIVELSDEEWNQVLNVNLNGTFKCCRAAARIMERQESGCIVNLASINGQNPAAWVAAYNVAKALQPRTGSSPLASPTVNADRESQPAFWYN